MDSNRLDMILDALANETRRDVIHSLAFNPSSPTDLAEECNISLPGMHKHLKILEDAKLVRRQKVGRINFVALNPKSLQIAQRWIAKYQTHWGTQRDSLENYIQNYSNLNSPNDEQDGE